jgi:hypothetical protein
VVNRHPGRNARADVIHSCNSRSFFCFLPPLIRGVRIGFHGPRPKPPIPRALERALVAPDNWHDKCS